MKKSIMFTVLTLLLVYVILIAVGCKSGNLFISIDEPNKEENIVAKNSGDLDEEPNQNLEEDISFAEENEEKTDYDDSKTSDEKEVIDEIVTPSVEKDEINEQINIETNCVYNESGRIIIAMYHKFASTESDEWTRSYDNFYKDLKYLYDHGYRSVSLSDYLNNTMVVPVGCTPIIFTFDDGSKGQFNLVKNDNGDLVVNPESAVGVMEKFYKQYPEFGLNGTFFINGTGFFGNVGTNAEKLDYLISRGFEIGNHTNTHVNLGKASKDEIQKEVGSLANMVRELTNGYEINSLALPNGVSSKEYRSYIAKGSYEGKSYENKIVLLVGAEPVYSPNSGKNNLLTLPRVRARGGDKEVTFDLYYWLDIMEKNPKMKYERIS
jgi:peptidoglycan/xylan/chitin deacetylase (PgdA/CDA1 family)